MSEALIAAFGVFLFSFFEKIGSGGHTNSHGHPHFSLAGNLLADQG
jgi:hypothetical protein